MKNHLLIMQMVILPKLLYEQICRHAERTYPEECCGLLLGEVTGKVKSVLNILETDNEAEDRRHRRYCVPPKAFIDAENTVREKGWEILGVYHSHPDHPAEPSAHDRERAVLHFEYVIVRVAKGRATKATCWILRDWDSEFEKENLRILD
jgi:proteasome lid subunit RPN8/RPN11